MAEFLSDKAKADYRGSNLSSGQELTGRISILKATVTFADTSHLDEDDLILALMPKGTVILPALSYVESDGGVGTTATINVGTVTSPSAVATALNVAAAGITQFDGIAAYELTVDENITADFEALATPATGALVFYIAVLLP
jgi:hypothetical protein